MTIALVVAGLRKGVVRFVCAAAGIAVAAGAVVFFSSLAVTNSAQGPELAAALVSPWRAWSVDGIQMRGRANPVRGEHRAKRPVRPDKIIPAFAVTVDYRPDGKVMQGPPAGAVMGRTEDGNPFTSVDLSGNWCNDDSGEAQVVCTSGALKRFGRGKMPPVGSTVKFVGQLGTMEAKVVGVMETDRMVPGLPTVFANKTAWELFAAEQKGKVCLWKHPPENEEVLTPEKVGAAFMSDEQRNMGMVKNLLLMAAALTAFCLLVNSLFLSIESRRRDIAMLRIIGMERFGTVKLIMTETWMMIAVGVVSGICLAAGALTLYVYLNRESFPAGVSFSFVAMAGVVVVSVPIGFSAVLAALKRTLSLRPIEAVTAPVRRRRFGMVVSFACGFGAFVAVEVWGVSLTKPFIPSLEWPDAIVSILPSGVSSFDIDKLKNIEGVRWLAEIQPLQVKFEPEELMPTVGGRSGNSFCNALLIGSDPSITFGEDASKVPFRFVAGSREDARRKLSEGDACVITAMMANARGLKIGDDLVVSSGAGDRKLVMRLPIVGILDLNWHMVTSRGKLRGLTRGFGQMTSGPVFVSFDTVDQLNMMPSAMVKMTHLWLDYESGFLREKGVFPAGREVEASIRKVLGDPRDSTIELHARDEVADGTLAHGNDLVGQMARIPFVFLVVLSIGFVAMLVASAEARRFEFAALRAAGATRLQLAMRLISEAVSVSSTGILIAVPFGSLAGYLFTGITRAAMAHWAIPASFVFPWRVVFEGAIGAIIFALVFAVPTSLVLIKKHCRR